jgi:hypothetical protein
LKPGDAATGPAQVMIDAAGLGGFTDPDECTWVVTRAGAMYWRKANAIHAWFVNTVQDGVDDCRHAPVGVTDVEKLRDLCQSLLTLRQTNPAEAEAEALRVLPPQAGFFFGSTDVNEYYWEDLTRTVQGLTRVLVEYQKRHAAGEYVEIEYHSSW